MKVAHVVTRSATNDSGETHSISGAGYTEETALLSLSLELFTVPSPFRALLSGKKAIEKWDTITVSPDTCLLALQLTE